MRRLMIAAIAMALPTGHALADRQPNDEELGDLTAELEKSGYVSWEEIELDDDGPYWEVDDARRSDGSRWDLKLSVDKFTVIKKDRED